MQFSTLILTTLAAVAAVAAANPLLPRQDVCGGGCDWTVTPDPCPGELCMCFKTVCSLSEVIWWIWIWNADGGSIYRDNLGPAVPSNHRRLSRSSESKIEGEEMGTRGGGRNGHVKEKINSFPAQ